MEHQILGTTMFAENFAEEVLKGCYAEARSRSLLDLKKLMAEQGDPLEAEVSPGEEGLASLCIVEKARWMATVQDQSLWVAGTAGVIAALACTAFMLCSGSNGSDLDLVFAGTSAIIACCLSRSLPTAFGRLRTVVRQGFDAASPDIFENHGRSIWMVGSRGVYVALNKFSRGFAKQIEFMPFDGIGAIRIKRFEDETLVSLLSKDDRLIRVMIFPGLSFENAREDLERLIAKIPDRASARYPTNGYAICQHLLTAVL